MSDAPTHDCGETMLEVDLVSSEKMNWVCPECAPDFALVKATSHTDVVPSQEFGHDDSEHA